MSEARLRIRVLSDLHREFGPTEVTPMGEDVDLVVLAGDVATKQNALTWIREFCGRTPAAYVCGNHEFYGDKYPRVIERLQEATRGTNVHVLEDGFFEVNGWFIYGCTLWTDMALIGPWQEGAALAAEQMNDYKRVRNSQKGYRKLVPADTRGAHLASVAKLEAFFETHDPRRTVVVTHHAPSALSLPERRRAELISCAYASHLDDLIRRHQPMLWVHGHIHHSSDYWIGRARVVANPQGYPETVNPGFQPWMMVNLEPGTGSGRSC